MDFELDETLTEVRDLARKVLGDRATTDRVRQVEAFDIPVDEALWQDLADTGLLGLVVPEEYGGAGLGLSALCVVLEEQGRTVAPVPLWPAGVAALAVARHGSPEQAAALLAPLADGSGRGTVALEEYAPAVPSSPVTVARCTDDGWTLTGTKAVVPTPDGATHVIVSAATDAGPGLFVVAADAPGVEWDTMPVTSHDLAGELRLSQAPAQALGVPGDSAVSRTVQDALAAVAALQLGVAQGALALAVRYLGERQQFGRPLGSFQAVQHQVADSWIDIDAMRVTTWQAITDLEEGVDAATTERSVLVAAWWTGQGGLDVVHRVQHLHGGIGVDVDYPVHRFFLWGKQLSGTLGGPDAALEQLGDMLRTEQVTS